MSYLLHWRTDPFILGHYQNQICRSHTAGEDLPVDEQDQGGVRVRARAAEGRCEAYQVHIMCVVDDGSRERAR